MTDRPQYEVDLEIAMYEVARILSESYHYETLVEAASVAESKLSKALCQYNDRHKK